ncbi:MAG TPA: DUF1800 family protein [Opitutaceae bacterium]|nr:DUF1800 family protein [Opitutaceae bacterium]
MHSPIRLVFSHAATLLVLTLGLPSVPAQEPRLSALSSRAYVGTGAQILIPGISISGGTKTVLIRASGPSLAANYPSLAAIALANPRLDVYADPNQPPIASNDDWGTPLGAGAANGAALSAAFASVGLTGFAAGSKDAALLLTLPPGAYSAQVSGVGATTGVAIVEAYEVDAGTARLNAISTRAQVGTGDAVLIPGIAISAGSGTRRFIVRAAGPGLAAFFPGAFPPGATLADPTISVVNLSTGAVVASNDDWGTPVGPLAYDGAALAAAFPQSGMFPLPAGSKDAALIADFAPGAYTVQVSGVAGTTGIANVEVYDITPTGGPASITISASDSSADESGGNPGEFTLVRIGDTLGPLTVSYGVSGSATNGVDYPALSGAVTFAAGASSARISLQPFPDTTTESSETVTLTLVQTGSYTLGATSAASVTISNSSGTLYVATLRPAGGAAGSTASGLASIVLSPSGNVATVNVSFSNLSSGQAGAHLFLGNSTSAGDYVLNLPLGQVTGYQWTIQGTGTYTATQIIDALKSGLIYVGIDTGLYPAGEVRGAFLSATGSQVFVAPVAPPAVNITALTAADAARVLTQATFGPKKTEIDALANTSLDAWITAQMALPSLSHRTATATEHATAIANGELTPDLYPPGMRQRAWFSIALTAPDQLRQRVAFALSEIFVISDASLNQAFTEPLANYNDLLASNAFGNFRTLLEQVTLSPVMGTYLSHLRNAKADPVAGTNPDENYAREVMQLFTIGLVQLQPDGTLKLDGAGLPIPTYDQTTITEMAKVFTGWGYFSTAANPSFRGTPPNYIAPMMIYASQHENSAKTIVNGTVIPANLGGVEDLKRALDTLFNHPNTPPFICRQLIQRLVTDNPSPGYVYRVAQKFENNGSGVRGDLGAVVRAILTDYEARSTSAMATPGYGKLKEPLLRFTGILRSFGASSSSGRNRLDNVQPSLMQAALRAPSVFNFFEPGYVYPGSLAAAGLVAPEFQITNDTTAISVPNFLRGAIFLTATGGNATTNLILNTTAEQALVGNVPALLDHLSLVMAGGQLGTATRTRITTAMGALSGTTTALERAQSAILLIATSPEGSTQR